MPTIKEPKKASASTGGFEDDGKENQSTATCTIADPKNERGSGNVRDGCGSRREYRQMELLMVKTCVDEESTGTYPQKPVMVYASKMLPNSGGHC
ncbi:unnamed protein product [Fusarium graminearum]|nr:unnamed protein product [Fusarium graminearum]